MSTEGEQGSSKPLLGINPVCFRSLDRFAFLRKSAQLGFKAVEILAFRNGPASVGRVDGFWPEELEDKSLKSKLIEALSPFRFVAVHAPFVDLPLFSHNIGVEREARRQIRNSIQMARQIGAEVVSVHACHKLGYSLEEFWDEMVETFRRIGDWAEEEGIKVGVETGYPPDEETFCRLVEQIDHPSVGVCFDVGHVVAHLPREAREARDASALNDAIERMVRRLAERIVNVHVHDVRPSDFRDHREVGTGAIDFPRFLGVLLETGYRGPLILELEESEEDGAARRSKDFLDRILERCRGEEGSKSEGG